MKKMSSQSIGFFFAFALALQAFMSTPAVAFGPARPYADLGDDLYKKVQNESYPAYGAIRYLFQQGTPVVDLKQVKANRELLCKVDARYSVYAGQEGDSSLPEVAIVRLSGNNGLFRFETTSEFLVYPSLTFGGDPTHILSPANTFQENEPIMVGVQDYNGVKRLATYKTDMSGPSYEPEFRLTQSGDLVIRVLQRWFSPVFEDIVENLGFSYMLCK